MTEKMNRYEKPKKISTDQPLIGTGIPPMGSRPPGMSGKPPAGWQPPMADISWVKRKFLDVPYNSQSKAQSLDIYLPENGMGPFPVIVQIHGGAFAIGDKRDIHLLPFLQGIELGYAVISINYRLSNEAKFPAAVQDVKAAICWIRENQSTYFLDSNRIAACGGSAGGNLAAMLGVTGYIGKFDDHKFGSMEYSSNVQAVVDWFGPIDFLSMDEQSEENGFGPSDHNQADSPESRYLGAPITQIPAVVESANPTTYIHPNIPPFLIQHGKIDQLVPMQQSINFAKELRKVAPQQKIILEIIENAGHGDPLFETKENMAKVFSFLNDYLNN